MTRCAPRPHFANGAGTTAGGEWTSLRLASGRLVTPFGAAALGLPNDDHAPTSGSGSQKGQLPGAGVSIRLVASFGRIWTATVSAGPSVSLRNRCTWPLPGSTKPSPAS